MLSIDPARYEILTDYHWPSVAERKFILYPAPRTVLLSVSLGRGRSGYEIKEEQPDRSILMLFYARGLKLKHTECMIVPLAEATEWFKLMCSGTVLFCVLVTLLY